jgi:hypothetical protein
MVSCPQVQEQTQQAALKAAKEEMQTAVKAAEVQAASKVQVTNVP